MRNLIAEDEVEGVGAEQGSRMRRGMTMTTFFWTASGEIVSWSYGKGATTAQFSHTVIFTPPPLQKNGSRQATVKWRKEVEGSVGYIPEGGRGRRWTHRKGPLQVNNQHENE